MKKIKNWDSYRRKQCNIEKAVYNPEVNNLIQKNYIPLYQSLVKNEWDLTYFQDAFLKITHQYNPEEDFVQQFIHLFKIMKGGCIRDDNALLKINQEDMSVYSGYNDVYVKQNGNEVLLPFSFEQEDTVVAKTNNKLKDALLKESREAKNKKRHKTQNQE